MKIVRSFLNVSELFFPMLAWLFIFIIYFSFSWFFDESLDPWVYFIPFLFLFVLYLGYYFVGGYKTYDDSVFSKRHLNLLIPAIIGFIPVVVLLINKAGNLDKELATIREEHLNEGSNDIVESIYTYLFPLLLLSFILVNFNNLKYKVIINILAILSCFAFIPINGGRVNFLIFIAVYIGLFTFKNFKKLKENIFINFLKFIGLFFVAILLGAIFSIARLGSNSEDLVTGFYRLQFVSNSGLNFLLQLPDGIGTSLATFIYTFYDYTGGCVYYYSVFFDNAEKLNYHTYGVYNFSIFIRATDVDWNKTHERIDNLYLKSDIKYNVWAGALRDFTVDFGFIGAFVAFFMLSLLLFYSRKFLDKSYSAQLVFFLLLAFFLFAPFHSLFYIDRYYQVAFVISLLLFIRHRLISPKKLKLNEAISHNT
jgi:hypothetical protein